MGGKPLSLSAYYDLLHNPYCYGKRVWAGKVGEDEKHVSTLMTEEEYWRVQEILGSRGVPRPRVYKEVLYRQLLKCGECRSSVIVYSKNKTLSMGVEKSYYFAKCNNKNDKTKCAQHQISIEQLSSQVEAALNSIEISHDFYEWAVAWLKENNKVEDMGNLHHLKVLEEDLEKQRGRLSRLVDLRLDNGVESVDFELKKDEIKKNMEEIEGKIKYLNNRAITWAETAEKCFTFAKHAKAAYEKGDLKVKMTILRTLGSNFFLTDRKLVIEMKKPFAVIRDNQKLLNGPNEWVEPEEGCNNSLKPLSASKNSTWWTVAESNRRSLQCECSALPTELTAQVTA